MPLFQGTSQASPAPADFGLAAWTFDPTTSASTGGILTPAGTVYAGALFVRSAVTVSTAYFGLTASGSGLTSGQCGIGLWSAAGTLVAVTGDLSATFAAAAGAKNAALNAVTSLALTPGMYWAGAWYNGTTGPTLMRDQQIVPATAQFGLTAATMRYGSLATGVTTPASAANITPGNNSLGAGNGLYYFAIG